MTSTAPAPAPSPAHQPTSSSGATKAPVYPTPDGLNRGGKSYDAQIKQTWKRFEAGVEDIMSYLGEPIQEEVVKLKQD